MANAENGATRYAVVVGVNNYEGARLLNLNFCAKDAETFYDALISYAEYDPAKVVLFSDGTHQSAQPPTYTDILSTIQQMCVDATENDSILLFFAGHGTRDDKDSYLLTREFRANVLSDSSIAMSKVNEYFQSSNAKFKMRFFDACHSGRIGLRGFQNPDVQSHLVIEAEGWATLAACKEDQYAHELAEIEQGIFSFFLVRGLRGDASIDGTTVTLDNLKVYVMDKIIDLTKKRGIEQTPVFAGAQAGNLTLSRVAQREQQQLPETLAKLEEVEVAQLEPEPEDTDTLLSQVRTMLQTPHPSASFVASDQAQKLEIANNLTEYAFQWLSARAEKDNAALPPANQFQVQRTPIDEVPLNRQVAAYLYKSRVRQGVEWTFQIGKTTRTRRVEKKTRGLAAIQSIMYPEYVDEEYEVEIATGITQPYGYPNSTVTLHFQHQGHLFPSCCMTIAMVPCTFGLCALCYFASTTLRKEMQEDWDPTSFSGRLLSTIALSDNPNRFLESQLTEIHPQFVSFIGESMQARQLTLQQLGAVPDTSLM